MQSKPSFSSGINTKPICAQVLDELLQVKAQDLKSVTSILQTIFLFFQGNLSYFLIIDRLETPNDSASMVSMNFAMMFFYYLKMIIQILFDHDSKIQEFNLKNGISSDNLKKPIIDKNLRFSIRNREQMESFLTDGVRQKLDFYKQLEDMIVPTLFTRNISYVMTLSRRITTMIDGMIQQIDNSVKFSHQQMAP